MQDAEQMLINQQDADARSYALVLRAFFRTTYTAAIGAGKDNRQALDIARTAVADDGQWYGGLTSTEDEDA